MTNVLPQTTTINLRVEDEIAYVTLNRPRVRNAMNLQMVCELQAAFAAFSEAGARVIVMRGAEGNFCAGGDIAEMVALMKQAQQKELEAVVQFSAAAGQLFKVVNQAPQAVIAILEGTVLGGGLGLACTADICIALSAMRFGLPETSLGLIPAQVVPFIRRKLGHSYARLLAIAGGQFDARFAERIGLVHYLVADETELQLQMAQSIARLKACAPGALGMTKQLMLASLDFDDGVETPFQLGTLFAQTMAGEESREGTAAFAEKRKPVWNR